MRWLYLASAFFQHCPRSERRHSTPSISVETAAVLNNATGSRSTDATMAATTAQLSHREDPETVANLFDQMSVPARYAGTLRTCPCIGRSRALIPVHKNAIAIRSTHQRYLVKIPGRGSLDHYTDLRQVRTIFASDFIQSHAQISDPIRWRLFQFDQSRPRLRHPEKQALHPGALQYSRWLTKALA